MGLKLERARAGGGQSRELPALNRGCRPLSWPPAASVTGIQRESPGSNSNPTVPGGTRWDTSPRPQVPGLSIPETAENWGIAGPLCGRGSEWKVEDQRTERRKRKSPVGGQASSVPRQSTGHYSPPRPANAALPHAVGSGALPGVANALLSLLHRREERREQEERWCEGKSPGARRPVSARDLRSGLGQAPGLAHGGGGRPVGSRAKLLSPDHPVCAPLAPTSYRVSWEQIGQWQVAWVAWSPVKGQMLRRRLGLSGAVARGYQRAGNGH